MTQIDYAYGVLIPQDFIQEAKSYQYQIETARHKGIIAQIDKTQLPNINMYGMPLSELLSKSISDNRCHQTAVALSLAIPNCEIVFANLRKRAAFYHKVALEQSDETSIMASVAEAKALNKLEPTYNHSYIIAKGQDIIDGGLKFKTKNGDYHIDSEKEYIIDAQLGEITDAITYSIINHPSVILSFNHLSNSRIWNTLNAQKELQGKNYKLNNLVELLNVAYSTGGSELNNYLSSIIGIDASIFVSRPCSRQNVFKSYEDLVNLMSF